MSYHPEVVLSCVHLYSMIGNRKKSKDFDQLFVRLIRDSAGEARLDSGEALD